GHAGEALTLPYPQHQSGRCPEGPSHRQQGRVHAPTDAGQRQASSHRPPFTIDAAPHLVAYSTSSSSTGTGTESSTEATTLSAVWARRRASALRTRRWASTSTASHLTSSGRAKARPSSSERAWI